MSGSDSAPVIGHSGSHITEQSGFVIVSPKHTRVGDPFITFWRPGRAGYAWPLSWAGVYSRDEALDICDHEDTFAVPLAFALSLAKPPKPGLVDGDAGPVIRRTTHFMRSLWREALPLPDGASTRHTPSDAATTVCAQPLPTPDQPKPAGRSGEGEEKLGSDRCVGPSSDARPSTRPDAGDA